MLIYDFIYLISCLQIIIFIFLTNNRESLAALNNSLDGSFQNYDLTFHAHARRRISRRSLQLNGFDISNNIERTHKCAGFIMELSRFIYLLLFLFGNVILFSDDQCPRGKIKKKHLSNIKRKKSSVLVYNAFIFNNGIYIFHDTISFVYINMLIYAFWLINFILLSN